jgi:Zn-dependent peptidase ImmA (M78 family)/DNA-binding XRE family transcriptional regulator
MSDPRFNPSRLSFARRRRGLRKTNLACLLGVDVRSITAYEAGEFVPDDDRVHQLASILGFPLSFFHEEEDVEQLDVDVASFRAMKSMTASQRDIALSSGAMALLLNSWIEARFELPAVDLPDLSREEVPEEAAETLRRVWKIGNAPVKNMVHLLEAHGVRVFSLAIDALEVDAYSMWYGGKPFVFLNTKKSCEHSRFDAAHELGHLVLHRHGSPQGQATEQEANAFASAFLIPRAEVFARAPRFATLDQLVRLKRVWIVSVAALTYRLHALHILSDWHYRQLCIQMGKAGYRRSEPMEAPRESSQILSKVFAMLRGDGLSKHDVARDLKLLTKDIDELVFGLTLTGIDGGNPHISGGRRPTLRAVQP